MKVDITGRHIEITEPLRAFVTSHIEKIHEAVEHIQEVHVVLTVEKHQVHKAEASVKTSHEFFHVDETSTDMYTSIATVADKIDRHILKSKDKTVTRKRHGFAEKAEVLESEA